MNFSLTSVKKIDCNSPSLQLLVWTIYVASRIFNNSDTSINLNFIHQFTIMLIRMPSRNGHPVDLRTQFWQPWWYACVRVHHACYRLLIRSKITYLDVSSATSRGIQPSPKQKRPSAVGASQVGTKYFTQLPARFCWQYRYETPSKKKNK